MMGIGFPELMIILVIIMIIFGAGKLPEIGSAFGRSIKNFKSSMKEAQEQDENDQLEEGQQASIEEGKDAAAEENLTDEEKEALARKKAQEEGDAKDQAMKEVRTIARILGPRGLMPNPKSGTVSDDIEGAVKAITQGGRVEYKMDKQANIGVVVGKRSFSPEQLSENINTVFDSIGQVKPEGIKDKYILSATLSGTMSPGIKLEPAEYSKY